MTQSQSPGTSDGAPTHGIQVITRAAEILRSLEGHPNGLSLSQIAERAELPRSTVHRIVTALVIEGLLVSASPNGRVRIGPELLRLAAAGRRDVQVELRPLMQRLFEDLNETIDLARLDGDHLRFIDQIPAPHRLRAVSSVGATFPLHCTANGKAVLALLPDEEIKRRISPRMASYTPATITRRSELLAEIAEVRESGVAFDREEHTIGICAVSLAITDANQTPVAIAVPMPRQRFDGREDELIRAVQGARTEAQQLAGLA
jgi:DNA-binding IclR family transcriptional regulator